MRDIQAILGKSVKRHTMWGRVRNRGVVSAADVADSGYISREAATEFLMTLEREGVIEAVPGAAYAGTQTLPLYQLREGVH